VTAARSLFDAAYYRRFYRERPVHDARHIARLASGVTGLCGWWGVPLRRVLDVGAGTGLWRDWFARERPSVRYQSIDVSAYACDRYGHEHADISTWRPARPADLVICQGVLQYLDDRPCAAAIGNLAAATRSVLYLEVPTTADRDEVIDPEATDLDINWRSGAWYRRRLREHFVELGCGLHAARSAGRHFYELERR
jgi:trans-aconitate methyltransferase